MKYLYHKNTIHKYFIKKTQIIYNKYQPRQFFFISFCIDIQYWSVDGKYRIHLTRLRNGVKDELLASLSPRFAPSFDSIYPAIHDVLKNNINSLKCIF
jgi:hypothetical protein